jgi:hypothetical protein
MTAAQHRNESNRSHRMTSAFQLLDGASGRQASEALLIGTVPMSVIKIQVSKANTPAHWNPKPGPAASRTNTATPDAAVVTKMAGTSTHSLRTSA